jgi:hypothetical protein
VAADAGKAGIGGESRAEAVETATVAARRSARAMSRGRELEGLGGRLEFGDCSTGVRLRVPLT